jgi:hypothetical protein
MDSGLDNSHEREVHLTTIDIGARVGCIETGGLVAGCVGVERVAMAGWLLKPHCPPHRAHTSSSYPGPSEIKMAAPAHTGLVLAATLFWL